MKGLLKCACVLAIAACSHDSAEPAAGAPITVAGTLLRRPVGVYAHVSIHNTIAPYPDGDWTSYLSCLYDDMLANPGVSGLQVSVHWGDISTSEGAPNDWRYVQAAFDRVDAWNAQPGAPQKTLQLIVTPGFDSPAWLLDPTKIPSCDGLFDGTNSSGSDCGTITIQGYHEPTDGDVLPLPWNQTYIDAWNALLTDLKNQFGDNPDLVSIEIAGPTAATTEMFEPNDKNTTPQQFPQVTGTSCTFEAWKNDPSKCCTPGTTGCKSPTTIWETLIDNKFGSGSPYADSDQVFVDAWKSEIVEYEKTFDHLTLILTPADGEGYVNFAPVQKGSAAPECHAHDDQSCEAVAQVVASFESYPATGQINHHNGKGVQVSGLVATLGTLDTADFDVSGLRMLGSATEDATPYSQLVAGAQFDHPFSSTNKLYNKDGCFETDVCGESKGNCTLPADRNFDEVAQNVFATVFHGTPASAASTTLFGNFPTDQVTGGPLNYLQVYYEDIQYAEQEECAGGSGSGHKNLHCDMVTTSAQTMIEEANQWLYATASPGTSSAPVPPVNVPVTCPPASCYAPRPPVVLCGGRCSPDQYCQKGSCVDNGG